MTFFKLFFYQMVASAGLLFILILFLPDGSTPWPFFDFFMSAAIWGQRPTQGTG
jgi:hypothetical protein